MKCIYLSFCFSLLSMAQPYGPQTRLLQSVKDGTPPLSVVTPDKPIYRIESSRTVRLPDRKLTIRLVQPPVLNLTKPQPAPATLAEATPGDEITATELLHVSATVHQQRLTQLCWWTEGREHSAWTDINFHNLEGITSFAHNNREYAIIMGIGNDETMPRIAWRSRTHGSFLLPQQDADNPKAVEVAAAFTSLYAKEKDALIAARFGREKAARKAASVPPKPPAEIVLNIWDKPSRPLTASEKARRDAPKEDRK